VTVKGAIVSTVAYHHFRFWIFLLLYIRDAVATFVAKGSCTQKGTIRLMNMFNFMGAIMVANLLAIMSITTYHHFLNWYTMDFLTIAPGFYSAYGIKLVRHVMPS
jgi:hypothetical protein